MNKAKDNFIVEWSWDIQNQTSGHTQVQLDVLQREGNRLHEKPVTKRPSSSMIMLQKLQMNRNCGGLRNKCFQPLSQQYFTVEEGY